MVLNPEWIKKFSIRANEFRSYSFDKHLEMLCLKIILLVKIFFEIIRVIRFKVSIFFLWCFHFSRLQNNNLKSILDDFIIEKKKKANCIHPRIYTSSLL